MVIAALLNFYDDEGQGETAKTELMSLVLINWFLIKSHHFRRKANKFHNNSLLAGFLAGKILTAMVLGKFFITIVFDGVYVYSSELFPTVVR